MCRNWKSRTCCGRNRRPLLNGKPGRCFASATASLTSYFRTCLLRRTPLKVKGIPCFRAALLGVVFATATHTAWAKSSQRPRVRVDASLVKDLLSAPVPYYPEQALQKDGAGSGCLNCNSGRTAR